MTMPSAEVAFVALGRADDGWAAVLMDGDGAEHHTQLLAADELAPWVTAVVA